MPSALVAGSGVFGASLADRLVARGWDVTLVDRFEPGDPRAESGGETRLLRYSHGPDEFYAASAWRSRSAWRELGVLEEVGVVWFARRESGWESDSERVLRAGGIPVERLDPDAVARLYPSLASDDLAFGLLEPEAGVLRASDGVRALVERAREGGARVLRGEARPDGERVRLDGERAPLESEPAARGGERAPLEGEPAARGGERAPLGDPLPAGGATLEADHVVWACGAWLAGLFPELVRLRVTRQEVVLFDAAPEWAGSPGWVDFDASAYGHGLIEPCGLKVASDREGEHVEPGLRTPASDAAIAAARDYLATRFPALADAPVRSAPSCHYSLTADGNFLFARHPEHERVWLLGGGSGHGYKHGPAVAEHAAAVLAGDASPEPRFALGERTPSRALRTAGS